MTQINQNFDNYSNYAVNNQQNVHNAQQKPVAVRVPDFYAPQKKSFKDYLDDNVAFSMAKAMIGPLIEHPVASVLTWIGCGFLLDRYNSAVGGEYEKSLLGKATKFGDRIENSKFIQSKPMQSLLGAFSKTSQKSGKILGKSAVLRAMKDTPTMPEWEMVKSEMIPQRQRVVHDFVQMIDKLKLQSDGFVSLNHLALSRKEKEALKKVKLSSEAEKSCFVQLSRLGKSEEQIKNILALPDSGVSATKKFILDEMKLKPEDLKHIKEDTIGNYIGKVQEATKNAGGKVRVGFGEFRPLGLKLGILTKPIERSISCDNIHNRLYSLEKGAKTATGRFMSKFIQIIHRGLTFGGGKIGILLFIAPAFVETAINVHKAENNQKVGTGVNNLVNHISWVFTFPLALQIMHHVFGAQNAGLSKDTIQKIRKLQGDFNKKNKYKGTEEAGKGFKDYEEYNKERINVNKKIKELKKVPNQKWYTKMMRKIAGIFTPDLGKLDAYNPGNAVLRKFSQIRNLPRNLWGVPARLVIFGLITMGVLDTALNKSIKLIFGEAYNSEKEEERKEAKKAQKKFLKEDLDDRLYEAQRQKVLGAKARKNTNISQAVLTPQQQGLAHRGDNNKSRIAPALNMNKNKTDNYTYIPSQDNVIQQSRGKNKLDNYTYIPSQENTISKENNLGNSAIRSYIPSQKAADIQKSWDNSGLQSALARADRAENNALKILAGNFEGM